MENLPSLADELTEMATEKCQAKGERDRVLQEIEAPEWELLNNYEDWGYLIPGAVRDAWPEFSLEVKLSLYVVAKDATELWAAGRARAEDS